VGGSTRVVIEEGAQVEAATLGTRAHADNNADALAVFAGIAGVNVELGRIHAETTQRVSAFLGAQGGAAPDDELTGTLTIGSGGVTLDASSTNNARIHRIGIDVSELTVQRTRPTMLAGGSTQAYAGGNFIINADGL